MDRFAVREAVVVRLGDRSPVAAIFEHSNNVIGVMFGLEVEEERGKPEHAEPCRGEDRRLETVRCPLVQDASWRPRGRAEVVRHVVEELLDSVWCLTRAERTQLRGREIMHTEH